MTTAPRSAFGAEFVGAAGFLNSPTYGLPPTFLIEELNAGIGEWRAGTMNVPSFDESVRGARAAYAALVGVPVDSVVMGGSVSAVLGLVAAAIPDGARVATLAGEFTSATFPFAAQAGRGVTLTEMTGGELVSSAADYDVVVASLVQSANGAVLDVEALRTAPAGTETITIIDVTQAAGWKKLDLGWVDVTAAAVYKWLLAPRGTAWMSVRDRVSRLMTPHRDAVEGHCVGLATRLRAEFELPHSASAIVSLPFADAAEKLVRAAGLRASVRAGAVRVGFHLYNTDEDLERLLDALAG